MAIFARDLSLRSYRNFERYELALDEGTLRHGGRTAPLCEIELEYVAGSEDAFHSLAAELAEYLSLVPEPESKLVRAMKL